jgi:hypothetical protein
VLSVTVLYDVRLSTGGAESRLSAMPCLACLLCVKCRNNNGKPGSPCLWKMLGLNCVEEKPGPPLPSPSLEADTNPEAAEDDLQRFIYSRCTYYSWAKKFQSKSRNMFSDSFLTRFQDHSHGCHAFLTHEPERSEFLWDFSALKGLSHQFGWAKNSMVQ